MGISLAWLGAALLGVRVTAAPSRSQPVDFRSWSELNGKRYADEELPLRQALFDARTAAIDAHNARFRAGEVSFSLGLNAFADLSQDEFVARYTGGLSPESPRAPTLSSEALSSPSVDSPGGGGGGRPQGRRGQASVNWVAAGAVSPVRDQGNCGACWAFSAAGAIEGLHFIQAGAPVLTLSPQELVDCSFGGVNQGCNGGAMDAAFLWVQSNGICSEAAYPYVAGDGHCAQLAVCGPCQSCPSIASTTGVAYAVAYSDAALQLVLEKQPISVGLCASDALFSGYASGVFSAACCGSQDHAVLAVGYGTDDVSGLPYWLIKNSWGSSWGEGGYIRLARGSAHGPGGQCGLLTRQPMYPTGPLPQALRAVRLPTSTASPSLSPSSTGLPSSSASASHSPSPGAPPTPSATAGVASRAPSSASISASISASAPPTATPPPLATPVLTGGMGGIAELANVASSAAGGPGSRLRSPAPLAQLNAEPRLMWRSGSGYDVECALQEAGLYFGNWWSQGQLRRLRLLQEGGGGGGAEAEAPPALSAAALAATLGLLRLNASAWPGARDGDAAPGAALLAWVAAHNALGAPTLAALYEWLPPASQAALGDRLALITGVNVTGRASRIAFNSGAGAVARLLPDPSLAGADLLFATRAEATDYDQGGDDSATELFSMPYPPLSGLAVAVHGNYDSLGETYRVKLSLAGSAIDGSEPDYSLTGSGAGSVAFTVDAAVFGLVAGQRYAILRFDSPDLLPPSGLFASSAWSYAYAFTAPASAATLFNFDAHADSSGTYSYRVVGLPAAAPIVESPSRTQSLGANASATATQRPSSAPSRSLAASASRASASTTSSNIPLLVFPSVTASYGPPIVVSASVALAGLPGSDVTSAAVRVLRRMLLLLLGFDTSEVSLKITGISSVSLSAICSAPPRCNQSSLVAFVVRALPGSTGAPSVSTLLAAVLALQRLLAAPTRALAIDAALQAIARSAGLPDDAIWNASVAVDMGYLTPRSPSPSESPINNATPPPTSMTTLTISLVAGLVGGALIVATVATVVMICLRLVGGGLHHDGSSAAAGPEAATGAVDIGAPAPRPPLALPGMKRPSGARAVGADTPPIDVATVKVEELCNGP